MPRSPLLAQIKVGSDPRRRRDRRCCRCHSVAAARSERVNNHAYIGRKAIERPLKCRTAVGRFVNTVACSSKECLIIYTEGKNILLSEEAVIDIGFGPGISMIT